VRLPFFKPYRMFDEFDHLSDAECERYVRDAYINADTLTARLPVILTVLAAMAWFGGWPAALATLAVRDYVPVPRSLEGMLVAYVGLGVLFCGLVFLVTRDAGVVLGIRRELRRALCRKCGQSLMGVPINSVGVDHDPAKQSVRCPECGRRWMLLEMGLTPRDLIPFEQRALDPSVATKRPRPRF
jgi:DNA-directed RNA polymerase subunit RPC12/RpoP